MITEARNLQPGDQPVNWTEASQLKAGDQIRLPFINTWRTVTGTTWKPRENAIVIHLEDETNGYQVLPYSQLLTKPKSDVVLISAGQVRPGDQLRLPDGTFVPILGATQLPFYGVAVIRLAGRKDNWTPPVHQILPIRPAPSVAVCSCPSVPVRVEATP